MTYEEAKEEIPNIDCFCNHSCICCNSEWYCPSYCEPLEKARRMNFDLILKCYARHDGDMRKVFRYIMAKRRKDDQDGM